MSTVMLLLAMHPDHQQTLFDELKRVMPHKDTDLTASHLNQLDFTTRCIKESLRLFPTVPFIARTPDQPIKINGIVIPAGVPIIMANGQIHRREEYWGNDAKQFNPNRFLRPECRPECQVAGSMLGFSYGPRNCIGMPHLTFASLSSFDSQIELLTFNQHFRFYSVSFFWGWSTQCSISISTWNKQLIITQWPRWKRWSPIPFATIVWRPHWKWTNWNLSSASHIDCWTPIWFKCTKELNEVRSWFCFLEGHVNVRPSGPWPTNHMDSIFVDTAQRNRCETRNTSRHSILNK